MNYYEEKDEPIDEPQPVCGVRPSNPILCMECKKTCPYEVITIKKHCIRCKMLIVFLMPKHLYDRWIGGERLQNVLPDIDTIGSKMIIYGICPPCQEFYFDETDEYTIVDNTMLEEDVPLELRIGFKEISLN